jgi:enoyl-CoA hydratase/carnithine racemase
MRKLPRCGPSWLTFRGNYLATYESSLSGARDVPFRPAWICRRPAVKAILHSPGSHSCRPRRARIGFQSAFTWLRNPSIVTIAAVQGHAIGAGFQLALNCDMRVLADDARFSMAEVTLGLVPDLGGTKRLTELVGPSRALEICVTGRRIAADEAALLGLANVVVPAAELPAAVADLTAAVIAADRGAVTEIKALLAGATQRTYAEQDRAEREAQTRRLRELLGAGE